MYPRDRATASFVKGSPRVDGSAVGDTRVCPCTADKTDVPVDARDVVIVQAT